MGQKNFLITLMETLDFYLTLAFQVLAGFVGGSHEHLCTEDFFRGLLSLYLFSLLQLRIRLVPSSICALCSTLLLSMFQR